MNELPDTEESEVLGELIEEFNLNELIRDKRTLEALIYVQNYDEDILKAIGEEINDLRFVGYAHGKRGTYVNNGCKGVLCRRVNTVYSRGTRGRKGKDTRIDRMIDVIISSHLIYKARAGRAL